MSSTAENAKRAGNLEVLRILSVSASTIDREWSSRVGVGKRGEMLSKDSLPGTDVWKLSSAVGKMRIL